MGVWSPWFYRQMEADNIQTIHRYSRVLFLFGLICSIGLMMIAPEAVRLFLAPSYHESIFLIPVLIIGMFFLFSYTFFYDVEYYYKKTKGIAVASLLAALENIVLNAIFIPVYGYVAAGFTTAIGYLTLMFLHFFFMKRLEKRRIYDMRTFALTCALLLVSAVFMYRTIDRPLIRYPAAILAILVILTALRKDLVQLLGVLRRPKEKD
jgi:O-antigen/teichoic acid export membrane protein